MTKSLIGFHVDLSNLNVKERNDFEKFVSETKLALLVVETDIVSDVNRIREIAQPETLVVFQPNISAFNKEGRYWSETTPEQYIERIGFNNTQKDIILAVAQDAYGIDKSSLRLMVDWITEVTELLIKEQRKVVVGNFPHAKIELHELMNGAYDKLIRIASENIGNVWLGFKEYSGIILPFGIGYRYDELKEIVPFSKWDLLSKELVDEKMWIDTQYNIEHFDKSLQNLMRHTWIYERCRELNLEYPRVLIVGTGWERVPSMAEGQNHIFDALQKRYNTPFLRGANSLEKVWDFYFPNITPHYNRIFRQMFWADNIFHSYCDGLAFNTWGGLVYKRETVTTFSDSPELLKMLTNYINDKNKTENEEQALLATEFPKEEIDDEDDGDKEVIILTETDVISDVGLDILSVDWKKVVLKSAGTATNIRQYPDINSEIISRITNDFALIQEKRVYFDGEDYWYPVRVNAISSDSEYGDFSNLGWVKSNAIYFKPLLEIHKNIPHNPTETLLNIKIEYNINNETHLELLNAIRSLLNVLSENGSNVNTYNYNEIKEES